MPGHEFDAEAEPPVKSEANVPEDCVFPCVCEAWNSAPAYPTCVSTLQYHQDQPSFIQTKKHQHKRNI